MDSQGRLLLPQMLREKAGLKGDVAVLGQQKKLGSDLLEAIKDHPERFVP